MIFEGAARWTFSERLRQYVALPFDRSRENPGKPFIFRFLRVPLQHAALREEGVFTIVTGNTRAARLTAWVDSRTGYVVKWESLMPNGSTIVVELTRIDERPTLSEDLFHFTGPQA